MDNGNNSIETLTTAFGTPVRVPPARAVRLGVVLAHRALFPQDAI